jgi:hypothetical protein
VIERKTKQPAISGNFESSVFQSPLDNNIFPTYMDHHSIITFDLTRAQKWQLYLIKGQTISIDDYVDLVKRSPFHNKLINDSFRTLKTNKDFQQKVPHTVITRVLNAAINHLSRFDSNETKFTYVQGYVCTVKYLYSTIVITSLV